MERAVLVYFLFPAFAGIVGIGWWRRILLPFPCICGDCRKGSAFSTLLHVFSLHLRGLSSFVPVHFVVHQLFPAFAGIVLNRREGLGLLSAFPCIRGDFSFLSVRFFVYFYPNYLNAKPVKT